MTPEEVAALTVAEIEAAFHLANQYVISDIESHGVCVHRGDGGRWYDLRHLMDPRERCGEVIDMFTEAVAYATRYGLITADPTLAHLVRINPT